MKTLALTHRSRDKHLKIEVPGAIINIQIGLIDANGNNVVYIGVAADGDRYADQKPWWINATPGETGQAFRIVQNKD